MRQRWLFLLRMALVALPLCAGQAWACDRVVGRPSVGVVLSGGGARAAAQIGVLAELERQGVPIDCIVGTSMGAVVGMLYASGRSPDEIRIFFENSDWKDLLLADAQHRYQGFSLKTEGRQHWSGAVARNGPSGLTLAPGLLNTENLREALRAQVSPQAPTFDQMRIPLRVIATDLETLDAVEFAKGDLVEATLASMAVPGLMAPETIEGRAYVDGGLAKQIGVDTLKAMGADIVIAVDMSVEPTPPGENPGLPATLAAIIQATNWKNRTEQIRLLTDGDLLIQPDMTGLSSVGFEKAAEGYSSGVAAARQKTADLARIVSRTVRVAESDRLRGVHFERGKLLTVQLENRSGLRDSIVVSRIGLEAGRTVTIEDVQAATRRVSALSAVGSVKSELTADGILNLRADPSVDRFGSLALGLEFDNSFGRESDYALKFRWIRRPLDSSGAELSFVGAFGTRYAAGLEMRNPFGPTAQWSLRSQGTYDARGAPFYFSGRRVDDFWIQRGSVSLAVGRELAQWGDVEIGYRRGAFTLSPSASLAAGLQPSNGETGDVWARFRFDTLDRLAFPTAGALGHIEVRRGEGILGADHSGTVVDASLEGVRRMGRGVLTVAAEGGWSQADSHDPNSAFFLGGFRRLSGLRLGQEPATRYALGRIEFRTPLTSLSAVATLPIWAGGTLEGARTDIPGLPGYGPRDFLSVSGYLAIDTAMGPLYGVVGHSFSSGTLINVTFGRSF